MAMWCRPRRIWPANWCGDRIDVAIFDTTQADPIAAVVAEWEVCRAKINLCRRTPLYAAGTQCVLYQDQARHESDQDYWQRKGVRTTFALEGIDLEEDLGTPPQRSAYGIPDQSLVLATAGLDLDRSVGEEFVEAVTNILRAHPHAIYLLIGDGELAWQKRKFESAGVGKRVGYAGRRKDLPGFLRIADLYLAEFPSGSAAGVLQAMAMQRPAVVMQADGESSQAATFAGADATIAGRDANTYVERVSRILRDGSYRQKLGQAMRARVEERFGAAQTVRQIEQLCEQLVQQHTAATAPATVRIPPAEPLAEVA